MPDVKPGLMILLGGGKPPSGRGMADGGEAGGEDPRGLQSFAEDLIQAVHGKDAAGVVTALQSFFDAVDMDEDEEGESESDEPEQEGPPDAG